MFNKMGSLWYIYEEDVCTGAAGLRTTVAGNLIYEWPLKMGYLWSIFGSGITLCTTRRLTAVAVNFDNFKIDGVF